MRPRTTSPDAVCRRVALCLNLNGSGLAQLQTGVQRHTGPPTGSYAQMNTSLSQIDLVQFINAQDCIHVERARHVDEGQGRKIELDERDVRREARHALVHVIERLQIWQLAPSQTAPARTGLLLQPSLFEHLVGKHSLDQLRQLKRMEGRLPSADAHPAATCPARRGRAEGSAPECHED